MKPNLFFWPEKHKVKEMCVAYFQARALIKNPRLAAINCQERKAFAVPYAKLLPISVLFSLRATFWGTVEAIKMPAGRQALQNAKFVTKEILKQLATANRVGRTKDLGVSSGMLLRFR